MTFFDRIFGQPSARVVALARLALAAVFLLATLADPSTAPPLILPVLAVFFGFALLVTVVTWNDWWVDARIALVTHAIDICFFITVAGAPQAYTSPYFLFFVFLLLSSAIRWTWRETTATGALVVALYVVAGLIMGLYGNDTFDTRRFIIRSGYLLVLSIVLIWFGVRRRFSAGSIPDFGPSRAVPDEPPLASALRQAQGIVGAQQGLAYWTSPDGKREAVAAAGDRLVAASAADAPHASALGHAFLFDARRNRALVSGGASNPIFTSADSLLGERQRNELAPNHGIAIPIESKLGSGLFLLWEIPNLHSDHLALGERLRSELAFLMERYALFSALRDGAIARERLGIARDLHDGIVQFLAGSAYKIEAISRSSVKSGGVADDLQELKQAMLLEQEDLRSSIGTLRQDKVSLGYSEAEAAALCKRLSRQWRVHCQLTSRVPDARIPARLHMDLLHMIKEGVANAVRHGAATSVRIGLSATDRQLELAIENDCGPDGAEAAAPWSIRERMTEIGGAVTVTNTEGATRVLVVAPIPDGVE